jgi:hypothetical protein
MSKCVTTTLFDANTDSGDVICIQGRDLSTNHLLMLFIQNPISVSPVCQTLSLLLFDAITDIVEMSYAYKDEIWVQIICHSFHPKPCYSPPCMSKCVIITVWCHHRHSGDVICIQGRDLSKNHLWFCLSKTQFQLIAVLQSALNVKMCHDYCLMPSPT